MEKDTSEVEEEKSEIYSDNMTQAMGAGNLIQPKYFKAIFLFF